MTKTFAIDQLFHYDSMLACLWALLSADWTDLIWNKNFWLNRNTSAWECMFKRVFPLSSSRKWASVILAAKARNLCSPSEAPERVPRASMSLECPCSSAGVCCVPFLWWLSHAERGLFGILYFRKGERAILVIWHTAKVFLGAPKCF